MKNLILISALLMGSAAFATNAFTASGAPIGPAGCGLGNVAFGTDNQIFAATVNGTGMQTFDMTTGTSNCGPGVFTSKVDIFVDSNKVALSNDAARGQGETIAALSSMLGCQDQAAVGATLKANYGEIFQAHKGDSLAISKSIQSTLHKTATCAGV